jgi:protein involved in polysaccharide export with SLBB domain
MDHAKTLGIVVAVTVLLAPGSLLGQSIEEKLEQLGMGDREKKTTAVVQTGGIALESVVDPETYLVGPSDRIAVNIWSSPPVNLQLTVTPEGSLIIPTVGEFSVAHRTLKEAKDLILAAVKRRYVRAETSVTLIQPRPIIVHVTGAVLNPGTYTLTAADQAGRAIAMANEILPSQRGLVSPLPEEEVSTRNIIIRHRDGSSDRVDLPLYLGTHTPRFNRLLCEGDVIVVPKRDPIRNVFGLYGEVNLPGRYELAPGDSLLSALAIGQGFTQLARTDSVIFSRLRPDGAAKEDRVVDLQAIAQGRAPNIRLQSGDRVIVPARVDLRQDYRVVVTGQVLNPGTYPITRNATRLSEAIRMAGGFTENASLQEAELVRRSVSPSEVELETLESARGGVASEDSSYYLLETRLRIRKEIVAVDFENLFVRGDTTQDVILRGDDYVNIPQVKRTVYIYGQVVTNGHVPYVPGQGVEYYLTKAGGLTDLARDGDIRVVKAKTRQWLDPDDTVIEPGDYIWVPREIDRPFGYMMNIIGQTASVLSVAVSIVLLVIQLNK